jgi:hypothetical protein
MSPEHTTATTADPDAAMGCSIFFTGHRRENAKTSPAIL